MNADLPASSVVVLNTLQINPGYTGTFNLNGSTLVVQNLFNFTDPTGTIDGGGPPNPGVLQLAQTAPTQVSFQWAAGSLSRLQLTVGSWLNQAPNASLAWSGGSALDCALAFCPDSMVNVTGAVTVTGCGLYNYGKFQDSSAITFDSGAMLNAGEFDMDSGTMTPLHLGPGLIQAQFTNAGTFQTVPPVAPPPPGTVPPTSTVSINFANAQGGTVEAKPNTALSFRASGNHQGQFIADAGGEIAFDRRPAAGWGQNTLQAGSSLQGLGLYLVDDAADLTISPNAAIQVNNFRLDRTGSADPLMDTTLEIQGVFEASKFDWRAGAITGDLDVGPNDMLLMDQGNVFSRTLGSLGTPHTAAGTGTIYNYGNIYWGDVVNAGAVKTPGDLNMVNTSSIINDGSLGQGIFTLATSDAIVPIPFGVNPISFIRIIAKGVVQDTGSLVGNPPPGGGAPAVIGVPINNQGGTLKLMAGLALQSGYIQSSGSTQLAQGTTLSVTGTFEQDGGTTDLSGGTIIATGGVTVGSGAVLSGYGTVTGNVVNTGEIDVAAFNTLTVAGAYTQPAGVTNVNSSATLAVAGALDQQAGVLNLLQGNMHIDGGYTVEYGATLNASGTITANLTNAGTLLVGGANNVGGLSLASDWFNGISGNYTQTASGALDLDVAGSWSYDMFMAAGVASLGGTLNVDLIHGFTPSPGDNYFVMHGTSSGAFSTVNTPTESDGAFSVAYDEYGMAFLLTFQGNQNNGGGEGGYYPMP